jgi:hypothetical protein
MNADRRQRLQALRDQIEAIAQEEEDAFFNLPDSLQQAPAGQLLESNYETLQEVVETIDGVLQP